MPTRRPARQPEPVVVLISVDGLNPDAIRRLEPAGRMPAFTRLIREGTGTLNARTAVEQTRTLPNHTSMLTGRPVSGPYGTRVTFNEDNGSTLERISGSYVPGTFDVVHDHGMTTTFLAEKEKFAFLLRSWDARNGAEDRTGRDNGRDKVDTSRIGGPDALTTTALRQLSTRPARFTFLHIAAPDVAGHAGGFLGPKYLEAVVRADQQIGRVLDIVRSRPALSRRTTVIVTSDHGGEGRRHGDPADPDNYRIPFFVWGRGVAPGTDLYRVDPGRTDPGGGRPGYSGPQPIRNLDAADLALTLLRLPPLSPPRSAGPRPLAIR